MGNWALRVCQVTIWCCLMIQSLFFSHSIYILKIEGQFSQKACSLFSTVVLSPVLTSVFIIHVEETQGKSLRLKHSQREQNDITKVEQFINSLKESGGDVAYGLDESTGVFQYLVYMSSSMKKLDISLSRGAI